MTDLSALTSIIAGMTPRRREGQFVFVAGTSAQALGRAQAMVMEDEGMSLVLNRVDADEQGLPYEFIGAWITLEVPSSLEIVGLTAAVSGELVVRGIGCNVIAGLRHGHILVPSRRAPAAMHALRRMAAAAGASKAQAEEVVTAGVPTVAATTVGTPPTPRLPSIVVNGTVGVGKTAAVDEIGHQLALRGIPHALIDLDELRRVWPAPGNDRFQTALELRNLAVLATSDRAAGAHVVVAAGVVETADQRAEYRTVLGADTLLVRLTASPDVVRERLTRRHGPDHRGLNWHLERAPELAGILEGAEVDDEVIWTDELSSAEVAAKVLDAWDEFQRD